MSLDEARIHSVTLADGATYDAYLPPTAGGAPVRDVLVSLLPRAAAIPRYRALELCAEIGADRRSLVVAPQFDLTSGFQWLGLWMPGAASAAALPSVRFDLRLLTMVEDAGERFGVETAQFALYGYSAGGQFAHRFLYLYPERLGAVAIGAPGTVTVPSMAYAWPSGLAGLSEVVGRPVDLSRGHRSRVLLLVGDHDNDIPPPPQTEAEQALTAEFSRFGRTRLELARTLHAQWLATDLAHTYVEVPGMAHADVEAGMVHVRHCLLGT